MEKNPIEHQDYLVMRHLATRLCSEPMYAQSVDRMTVDFFEGNEVFQHIYSIVKQEYRAHGYKNPIQLEWLRTELAGKLDSIGADVEKRGMYDYVVQDLYVLDSAPEERTAMNRKVSEHIRRASVTNEIKRVVAQDLSDEAVANFIKAIDRVNTETANRELPQSINVLSTENLTERAEEFRSLLTSRTAVPYEAYNTATGGGLSKGEMGCVGASSGSGKAEPHSTIIPTPNGFRRFGDLEVGDEVFNISGKPIKILDIYEQGQKDMYRVTLSDGRTSIFNDEHLFSYYVEGGELETCSLRDMMDTGLVNDAGEYNFYIPLAPELSVVTKSHQSYSIDPRTPSKKIEDYLDNLVGGSALGDDIFETTNVKKAEKAVFWARSLGYSPTTVQNGDVTIVHLNRQKGHVDRASIVSIENMNDTCEMRCIYVDDPLHLYVTKDFMVTHNTLHLSSLATGYALAGLNVAYFALEELVPRMVHRFYKGVVDAYIQHTDTSVFDDAKIKLLADLRNAPDIFENGLYKTFLTELKEVHGVEFGELHLIKYRPYEMSLAELDMSMQDLTVNKGINIDVMMVDYPDLMDYDRSMGESESGGRLYASIRGVGQKYDVITWVASQLNRTTYGTDLKTEAHIEGSYRKQNALECLVVINQTSEEYENGFTRIYVAKARNSTNKGQLLQLSVNKRLGVLRNQTPFEANRHASLLDSNDTTNLKEGKERGENMLTKLNNGISGALEQQAKGSK